MACAAWRPSRIAHTTSDCPRRMSPAANTFGARRAVVEFVCLHVAARIELYPEVLDHAARYGMEEAHGQQHEVGRNGELAGRHRLHLAIEADAFQLLDLAVDFRGSDWSPR